MNALGIDIGGSGIKANLVDGNTGEVLSERMMIPTPSPASTKDVVDICVSLIDHFNWKGVVGIGFPGVVQDQVIKTATNLGKHFIGFNLSNAIEDETDCQCWTLNDADAAGIAEQTFGAARDFDGIAMLITVGTGLGTVLLTRNSYVPNLELGLIKMEGNIVAEKLSSGLAKDRENLSMEEWAKRFSDYLKYIHKLIWPQKFIIGGGIAKKFDEFSDYIESPIEVVPAQMHNDAGIIGAAVAVIKSL